MQRALAMLILFVGVGLAAAAGSMNGDTLTDYRSAQWALGKYQAALNAAEQEEQERLEAKNNEAADENAEEPSTSEYEALVAELRELKLLGPARGLPELVRDAHGQVDAKSADMIVTLRAAGLISRDPTMAQSRAEATMRLEDLRKLADSLAEQAAGGDEPPAEDAPAADSEATEDAPTNAEGEALEEPPPALDPALAEEWTLLRRAVSGDDSAIAELRAKGVVHAPADADDVRAVLDDPKNQRRAVDALVEAGLVEGPETIEARVTALETAAPLPDPTTRMAQWWTKGGLAWGGGVFLIVVGALLARRQQRLEQSGTGASAASAVDFKASLTTILERVDRLVADLADLQMDADGTALRNEIDAIQLELIDPIVDQRGRFIARHGLASFAEYFSPFSAGERNLARTWSALTDGHAPTAREAAARARSTFAQAHRAYMKADAKR